MENIKVGKKDSKLIIEIDLDVEGRPSKSGKSTIVASTCGNKHLHGVNIGVNVYK